MDACFSKMARPTKIRAAIGRFNMGGIMAIP